MNFPDFGPYTLSVTIDSVSAAQTLIYITAPSDRFVRINWLAISNRALDSSEQLVAAVQRITTLGTPTATDGASAIVKCHSGIPDAGSTVKYNVTASEPTYATGALNRAGFNSLEGYGYSPPKAPKYSGEDERPVLKPGESVGLRLTESPSAAIDLVAEITWVEFNYP
jgi:hypothetical protein